MSTPFHTSSSLTAPHGFFTREGGVSRGIYANLNCGPGSRDYAPDVRENRRRVAASLGFASDRLCTLYQIHSPNVLVVTAPFKEPPQADAMVTNTPGLLLGILTADCAPVLFADATAGVIGAAHAGWKGAVGGVLENTIQAMEQLGASRTTIAACIGPCIAPESYEVGLDFYDKVVGADAVNKKFFATGRDDAHLQFDLPAYVAYLLWKSGLRAVDRIAKDTCANEAAFFSYRRTTLRREPDYGRQLSAIGLREAL